MSRVFSGLSAGLVVAALAVGFTGCSDSSKDKMGKDKMAGDKMADKMGKDKMADKMSGDKMSDKMADKTK